jgi:hypothetical protein
VDAQYLRVSKVGCNCPSGLNVWAGFLFMTRKLQIQFVRDLSRAIASEIITQIKMGVVPKEWDGHELRVLLADLHEESACMSCIRRTPQGRAARNYRNTIRTKL